jgi:hypothetical protein
MIPFEFRMAGLMPSLHSMVLIALQIFRYVYPINETCRLSDLIQYFD